MQQKITEKEAAEDRLEFETNRIERQYQSQNQGLSKKYNKTLGLEIDGIEDIIEPFAAIIGNIFTRKDYISNDEIIEAVKDLDGKNFLVFDYGGGTLDITVVKNDHGRFLEVGTSELTGQAGDRFDELIAEYVWNKFRDKYASKYNEDHLEIKRKEKWRRILAIAERCKIELSTKESSDFLLNSVTGIDEDIRETITRETFENIISTILDSTSNKITEALDIANLRPEDINTVLLTGGTCNMSLHLYWTNDGVFRGYFFAKNRFCNIPPL